VPGWRDHRPWAGASASAKRLAFLAGLFWGAAGPAAVRRGAAATYSRRPGAGCTGFRAGGPPGPGNPPDGSGRPGPAHAILARGPRFRRRQRAGLFDGVWLPGGCRGCLDRARRSRRRRWCVGRRPRRGRGATPRSRRARMGGWDGAGPLAKRAVAAAPVVVGWRPGRRGAGAAPGTIAGWWRPNPPFVCWAGPWRATPSRGHGHGR